MPHDPKKRIGQLGGVPRPDPRVDVVGTIPPVRLPAERPTNAGIGPAVPPPQPRKAPAPAPVQAPATPLPPVSEAPARSLSPAPVSLSKEGFRVRWSAVKKALPWLLLGGTAGGGGAGGYFAGLKLEAAERAAMKAQGRENARRLAELEANLDQALERLRRIEGPARAAGALTERVDAVERGLAAETQSGRAERATNARNLEQLRSDLEARTPKLQGLPPK